MYDLQNIVKEIKVEFDEVIIKRFLWFTLEKKYISIAYIKVDKNLYDSHYVMKKLTEEKDLIYMLERVKEELYNFEYEIIEV